MSFEYKAYDDFFADTATYRNVDTQKTLTQKDIDALEKRINKYIPMSIRACLNHIGTAVNIASCEDTCLNIEETIKNFSHLLSYNNAPVIDGKEVDELQVLPIITCGKTTIIFAIVRDDDPSIYFWGESETGFWDNRFTTFVREELIKYQEKQVNKAVYKSIARIDGTSYQYVDTLFQKKYRWHIHKERWNFVEEVFQSDLKIGCFTRMDELQNLWIKRFSKTDLWKEMYSDNFKHMPYAVFLEPNP